MDCVLKLWAKINPSSLRFMVLPCLALSFFSVLLPSFFPFLSFSFFFSWTGFSVASWAGLELPIFILYLQSTGYPRHVTHPAYTVLVLGTEPKASCTWGKCSVSVELCAQSWYCFLSGTGHSIKQSNYNTQKNERDSKRQRHRERQRKDKHYYHTV